MGVYVTEKQKNKVKFIEEMLEITFEGDIKNLDDVGSFISEYYADAQEELERQNDLMSEAISDYYSQYEFN